MGVGTDKVVTAAVVCIIMVKRRSIIEWKAIGVQTPPL
jgi:hypothetical protein